MNNRKKAIIYILLSAFFFSVMSFLVRLAGEMPTFQKAFFRNFIAVIIAFFIFFKKRVRIKKLTRTDWADIAMRAGFGTIGLVVNFYAIDHMNIADATIYNKLSPMFVIIWSMVILKEIPRKRDWVAIGIAFIGALLVIRPGFNSGIKDSLIAISGGFSVGIAYTYLRKLGKNGVDGSFIVLIFSAASCLVCAPAMILQPFTASAKQVLLLLAAGSSAAAAQFSITKAYSLVPAKEISVYEYSQVVFAAIWSTVFLGMAPGIVNIAGYAVIIFAAWYKSKD